MAADAYAETYLAEVADLAGAVPAADMEGMAEGIAAVRGRGGRLFIRRVGGGAGRPPPAGDGVRKLLHREAAPPTDNVSELTARTNDEGWETTFEGWLRTSRLNEQGGRVVFSGGGGSREHNIPMNLGRAIELAKEVGASVYGIVGKPDGTAAQ